MWKALTWKPALEVAGPKCRHFEGLQTPHSTWNTNESRRQGCPGSKVSWPTKELQMTEKPTRAHSLSLQCPIMHMKYYFEHFSAPLNKWKFYIPSSLHWYLVVVDLWLLVVLGVSRPLLNSLQTIIKQSKSVSSTATIPGLKSPPENCAGLQRKSYKNPSAPAPTQPPLSLPLSVLSSTIINHLPAFSRPLQIWGLWAGIWPQPWSLQHWLRDQPHNGKWHFHTLPVQELCSLCITCWLWPSHTGSVISPAPSGCFPNHGYMGHRVPRGHRSYRTLLDVFLWRMFSKSSSRYCWVTLQLCYMCHTVWALLLITWPLSPAGPMCSHLQPSCRGITPTHTSEPISSIAHSGISLFFFSIFSQLSTTKRQWDTQWVTVTGKKVSFPKGAGIS